MKIAAAAVVVLLTAACGRTQPPPLPDVIPLVPAGRIERVTEFRWQGPPDTRFKLTVTDPGGVPLMIRETTDQRVLVERDQAATFPSGGYAWYIEVLDANGEILSSSRTQLFDVD